MSEVFDCEVRDVVEEPDNDAASILSLKADFKVDFVGHLLRSIMHLKYVMLADHRVLSKSFQLLQLNRFGRAVPLVTESLCVFLGCLVGKGILL